MKNVKFAHQSLSATTKVVGQIFETTNYNLFKLRNDNRDVKENIVKERMISINAYGQRDTIKCSKDYVVSDGQHRLEACRRLGVPVKYSFEYSPLNTQQLADLQTENSSWKAGDFTKSYIVSGNENYIQYDKFIKTYKEFQHSTALLILSNATKRNGVFEQAFKDGFFKVTNSLRAYRNADILRSLGIYYKGYNKQGFVVTILTMVNHKEFSIERLMRKMPKRCRSIQDFSKTEDYLEVMQDLYNWKEPKKVYFI
jgi:hypothetical protein